jgi:hypothetical protein
LASVIVAGSACRAAGADQNTVNNQSAYQTPLSAGARLQVSGAPNSISIDVERSDVQSALKSVLKQAGKQFVPDATVTGQVTLLLTDQPLDTVLKAICDACYLKYTRDPSGIYRFTRDEAAIKRAFTQLKELNSQLRAQLRAQGLDVPSDDQIVNIRRRDNFALGAEPADSRPLDRSASDAAKSGVNGPRGGPGETPGSAAAQSSEAGRGAGRQAAPPAGGAGGALKKDAQSRINNIHTDFIAQGDVSQFLGQNGRSGLLNNQAQYGAIVRQNNFVWFNIPEEKPEPVAAVLQLFSQQSNVPILVDQSIPSSLKFRVWGNLSPRQLPEALNVLAPTAHLQWRWIGNMVFVVPAPNFQVSFGDQGALRSVYPAPSRGESQAGEGQKRGGPE